LKPAVNFFGCCSQRGLAEHPRGRYLLLWLVSVVGAAIFEAPRLG
jgi:hypothetical protein